jgi:hypothetical protein
MTAIRRRKAETVSRLLHRLKVWPIEDREWDSMPAVGREFGSPDFERLMEEDFLNGVFAPEVKRLIGERSRQRRSAGSGASGR